MRKKMAIVILVLFLCLLFFPRAAVSSAREGLLLWYHSVFPVLFPFLFLSSLLIRIVRPEDLPKILVSPVMRLFRCSAYGAFVILTGFLCGFPVGARLSAELYQQKKISRKESVTLQGFANNLSPGFILSYLTVEQMHLPGKGGWFLFQILGAAFLVGILTARSQGPVAESDTGQQSPSTLHDQEPLSFSLIDDCIYGAMNSALRLCAYILLFSILDGILTEVLPVTNPAVLFLAASIEVSNGIRLIAESSLSFAAKYVAVSALAAFGGWSALAQSAGLARMDGEQIFLYTESRVEITLLTIVLSLSVLMLCQ